VTAQRLAVPRTWRAGSGDELVGEAGDWLVTDQEGGERTVRDEVFRRLHRHLDGDRWVRVGSVRARRVGAAEEVRSLEGVVTAHPGDWVLTDDEGGSWPVSDDYFRSAYAVDAPEPGA
jgi:hypothetical protein